MREQAALAAKGQGRDHDDHRPRKNGETQGVKQSQEDDAASSCGFGCHGPP